MNFDMSIQDNYASFIDEESGVVVYVDSFDNKEFEVRIGSLRGSNPVGKIIAKDDLELNHKIENIYSEYIKEKFQADIAANRRNHLKLR